MQGLINATAVGSLSSFQEAAAEQAERPPAAAVEEEEGQDAAPARAVKVIEPPVVDVGKRGSSRTPSPRLVDFEFNSLAELAERTTAAVEEARAAAQAAAAEASLAPSGWQDSIDPYSYESGDSLAADDDITAAAAAAAGDGGDEFAVVEAPAQLGSSSFDAPAVKAKGGDGEASPVSSYTLTAAKDVGSTTSTDGSSSSAGGCSTPCCGRFSSSSGASVASSSDGGSCCWGKGAEQDEGSVCSSEGEEQDEEDYGGGFGGLLAGLFGCCVTPNGACLSDDSSEEGESEGSEEFEDAWETASDASRCSSATKQTWTADRYIRRAK